MDTLERATAAANSGNRQLAARLVAEVLTSDPRNAKAWLLMSGLRESLDEQAECLKRALAIEPDNKQAKLRLAQVQGALEAKLRVLAEASKEMPGMPSPTPTAKSPTQPSSPVSSFRRMGPFVVEQESPDSDISAAEGTTDIEPAGISPAAEEITETAEAAPAAEEVAARPAAAAEEAVKAEYRVNVPLLLGMVLLGITFLFFMCYGLFNLYRSGAFAPYEYAPPQDQVPGTSAQVGSLFWQVNFWQDLGTELPGEERVQGSRSIRTRGRFILVSLRLENNTVGFGSFDTPVLIYGDGKKLEPSNRAQAWVPKEMRLSQFNKTAGRIKPSTSANIRLIYELPQGVTHPEGILVSDLTGEVIGQSAEFLIPYPHTGED